MQLAFTFFKYFLMIAVVLAGVIWLFLKTAPVFGGKPDSSSAERIAGSPNFAAGQFRNLVQTHLNTQEPDSKSSFWRWFFPSKDKNPLGPLLSAAFTPASLADGEFIWLGHSTILMRAQGLMLLTDPVFFRASPIPVFGKPFPIQHPIAIEDLPKIDGVVISHDHYDHLDAKAIRYLSHRVERFFVPLGVKAHLERWGVDSQRITELDWFESEHFGTLHLTLTPARHFSGRGFSDRNKTLWGSWVIDAESFKVYFSGDTGYSEIFREIGEKYGPFDIAFIENGAYNKNWAQIHMFPEEGIQASIDLKARYYFPIHWSKFDLSLHPWDEPIIRASAEANRKGVFVVTPLIGEIFSLSHLPQRLWWEGLRDRNPVTTEDSPAVETAR